MKKLVLVLGIAVLTVSVAVTAAVARPTKKSAATQVCVLLPDTKSSVRWEQFDKPAFAAAFKKAGLTATIVNALNDPQKQLSQAEQCLVERRQGRHHHLARHRLVDRDPEEVHRGRRKDDRLRPPDRRRHRFRLRVVRRQPRSDACRRTGVLAGMKAKGTYKPNRCVAQLWGGPTDANAFWFKSGNDDVLNPLFKAKKLTKGPEKFVPEWDAKNAQTIFEQMLVQTSNKIQGVVGGERQPRQRHRGHPQGQGARSDPAVSGQDATVQGVQNIISGWQTNTVYKYVPDEANATAAAAVALSRARSRRRTPRGRTARRSSRRLVIPPVSITKANYKRLFKDKFLKKSDVCTGAYKKYCK